MTLLLKITSLLLIFWSNVVFCLNFTTVLSDLSQPTDMVFLPLSGVDKNNTSSPLLIAQKNGELIYAELKHQQRYVIKRFAVRTSSEMGLLGLALHPDFAKNNKLYVNYTPKAGDKRTRISSFSLLRVNQQYQLVNEQVILEIPQPYNNHNGGQIAFGPAGYLYIGMGDGGSRNDPLRHGQNLSTLLGAMLRIDVNTENTNKPYQIPADNPFISQAGVRPEIWAYGLRNPWRFSFAPDGQLIAADVGQHKYEEVSVIAKGANLGWNIMEAQHCFEPKTNCNQSGLVLPKISYGREQGASITGGVVYQGSQLPALNSAYVYADYVSGNIWAVDYPSFDRVRKIISDPSYKIVSFTLDHQGEIYAADHSRGAIYKITQ